MPIDVNFGRAETILAECQRTKLATIENRLCKIAGG
jgi:hypothetical protein